MTVMDTSSILLPAKNTKVAHLVLTFSKMDISVQGSQGSTAVHRHQPAALCEYQRHNTALHHNTQISWCCPDITPRSPACDPPEQHSCDSLLPAASQRDAAGGHRSPGWHKPPHQCCGQHRTALEQFQGVGDGPPPETIRPNHAQSAGHVVLPEQMLAC